MSRRLDQRKRGPRRRDGNDLAGFNSFEFLDRCYRAGTVPEAARGQAWDDEVEFLRKVGRAQRKSLGFGLDFEPEAA